MSVKCSKLESTDFKEEEEEEEDSNERYDKFEEMCLQSIKPHFWRF